MRRERLTAGRGCVLLIALASLLAGLGQTAVGAGAAGRVKLRPCAAEGYGLEQRPVQRTARRPNAVMLTAGWLSGVERRHSCRLDTTIQLVIRSGSGGAVVSAHWNANAVLRPWDSVVHTWIWRNWCRPASEGPPTVEFGVPGRGVRQLVESPPACVRATALSTLSDLGTGKKYVQRPGDRIRPHILPKKIPPPLHQALIKVRNAWVVSDGYTLVAVYAGTAGNSPTVGRFAIIRQNEIFGVQYQPPDIVDVPRARGLKIVRAPRGASRETTAQRARLAFVSANGVKGFLDLHGDHVRVTARRH